ncbi:hypothetical protein BIV57_08035 [Mangrovactinospora gilvigrisea]|uniref:Uncharacterized protein n=1 Tax=Mangrovactinospora gilvigrisea TaxID=1428644 RepID=A0A1J7BH53_9ACTN|nr:hypothetical protein [Mangrovactinospora gilvigrisea]OIV38015.1 hypothetical protein BIV57_08035 [Mangrovactinospora gilvigrisea]
MPVERNVEQSGAFDELVERVKDQITRPGTESDRRAAEALAAVPRRIPAGPRHVQASGVYRRTDGPGREQLSDEQRRFESQEPGAPGPGIAAGGPGPRIAQAVAQALTGGTAGPQPPFEQPFGTASAQSGQFGDGAGRAAQQAASLRPRPEPFPPLGQGPSPYSREELRLDIDGNAPTYTVSGTRFRLPSGTVHWTARVAPRPDGTWSGPIEYKQGDTAALPHGYVSVSVDQPVPWQQPIGAHLVFSAGAAPISCEYRYEHAYFREVGIETDALQGIPSVRAYAPASHPQRPAELPDTVLTVADVLTRLGIKVRQRTPDPRHEPIDSGEAGSDHKWTSAELHDAMQKHFEKGYTAGHEQHHEDGRNQIWTLIAGEHEYGPMLTGLQIDTLGRSERRASIVFANSAAAQSPVEDEYEHAAFAQRMRFFQLLHETGRALGLPRRPEHSDSRSIMANPWSARGGLEGYFDGFRYQFDPDELRFLRHAPEQPEGRTAGLEQLDHHTFEQMRREQRRRRQPLELGVRLRRPKERIDRTGRYRYAMLEPVIAELRLRNRGFSPVVVDRDLLDSPAVDIVIAREGSAPKQWTPYCSYSGAPRPVVLRPGESLQRAVQLSTGTGEGRIDEPGRYTVYAAVSTELAGEDGGSLAAPVQVHVERPVSRQHERIGDDILTGDVRRVLAFAGSRVLTGANEVLREAMKQLPDQPIAQHAAAALAVPAAGPGAVLEDEGPGGKRRVRIQRPDGKAAGQLISTAYGDMGRAADTFGNVRLAELVARTSAALSDAGDAKGAQDLQQKCAKALRDRGVPQQVAEEIKKSRFGYSEAVPEKSAPKPSSMHK